MKKLFGLLVVCAIVVLMGQSVSLAACNPGERAAQFQKALQEAAQKNPSKLTAVQADAQALAMDVAKLMQEGKTEEICKRYDAMEAKLK